MYDVADDYIVSIDYGCIFNTATFEYPLSQLTSTDTILWSDLFSHLSSNKEKYDILLLTEQLKQNYESYIHLCCNLKQDIIDVIPKAWNVPHTIIKEKIGQLFDEKWIDEVWNNFYECLNDNLNHE
jgi:hypothetical protein